MLKKHNPLIILSKEPLNWISDPFYDGHAKLTNGHQSTSGFITHFIIQSMKKKLTCDSKMNFHEKIVNKSEKLDNQTQNMPHCGFLANKLAMKKS